MEYMVLRHISLLRISGKKPCQVFHSKISVNQMEKMEGSRSARIVGRWATMWRLGCACRCAPLIDQIECHRDRALILLSWLSLRPDYGLQSSALHMLPLAVAFRRWYLVRNHTFRFRPVSFHHEVRISKIIA